MATTFARFYNRSFDARPYTTLALSNSALSVIGDCLAQASQLATAADREAVRYDPLRSVRFAVFGFAMGPLMGRWVKFLEYKFPMSSGSSSTGNITALIKRVASDQAVMAPFGIGAFLGSMGVMERRHSDEIALKYRDLFIPAVLTNWKIWPVIQIVNFRFVPLPFRVPFQSTCGCFWTLYLSLLNSSDNREHPKRN